MGRILASGMRRYWLTTDSFINDQVIIQDEPFHHIFDVCRQEVGSKFEVLGYQNQAILVQVTEVQKKKALATVLTRRTIPELPRPHIVLALSIPRFQVMDSVVERAVEMGVAEIRPFFSEFSFVRRTDSLPAAKKDRWKKIVMSATQQSGRGELMSIHEPVSFSELLTEFNRQTQATGLFAYEGAAQSGLKDFARGLLPSTQEIWIFVGSEGGFSETEVQKIQDLGLAPITLGDQVLRVETACIALIAVLKYEIGLMTTSN